MGTRFRGRSAFVRAGAPAFLKPKRLATKRRAIPIFILPKKTPPDSLVLEQRSYLRLTSLETIP